MKTEREHLLTELRGLREKEQHYLTQLERTRIRAVNVEQKIKASEPVKESELTE